jgi:hypothetical protein
MAPRTDGVMAMSHELSPNSFSTNRFTKSFSNLTLDERDSASSPSLYSNGMMQNSMLPLRSSLQLITERGERLLAQICDTDCPNLEPSLIVEACNSSLQSELVFMLDEARLLLDNISTGVDSITSWRASLAQIRVDAYLEAIETAMKCPDRTKLDEELRFVVNAISNKLHPNSLEKKHAEDVALRVSPWNISSLAFDLTVGEPVHPLNTRGLPLKLEIRAIQEIQAKDIFERKSLSFCACKIHIERCVYEASKLHAGTGTVGDAIVVVRVSPFDERNGPSGKNIWETDKEEVWKQLIKEARM